MARHLVIPAREIRESASRSSGPGGQNVNKVSTRVTLRWNVRRSGAVGPRQRERLLESLASRLTASGDLVVHAGRARTRHRNREHARARLAELVGRALHRDAPRIPTRATRGSRERTLDAKRRRSHLKRTRSRVRREE